MNRIILPLDNKTCDESLEIMKNTTGKVWGYKLRRQIFEKGLDFVKTAREFGNVMIDFKFYDIPTAMKEAIELCKLANIITVHCTAKFRPKDFKGIDSTKLAGVTILTSMKDQDFCETYNIPLHMTKGKSGMYELVDEVIQSKVYEFAYFASINDYGYTVCSPKELFGIRELGIKKICPGIRPSWYQVKDDQQRTMTPKEARQEGANLLVIGRPLLSADDIVKAIELTNEEIGEL